MKRNEVNSVHLCVSNPAKRGRAISITLHSPCKLAFAIPKANILFSDLLFAHNCNTHTHSLCIESNWVPCDEISFQPVFPTCTLHTSKGNWHFFCKDLENGWCFFLLIFSVQKEIISWKIIQFSSRSLQCKIVSILNVLHNFYALLGQNQRFVIRDSIQVSQQIKIINYIYN